MEVEDEKEEGGRYRRRYAGSGWLAGHVVISSAGPGAVGIREDAESLYVHVRYGVRVVGEH